MGVNQEFGVAEVETKAATLFELELMTGGDLRLADLRGKVVMVDFWASWCAPCRQEAPALVRVYQEYAESGVEFVGIDIWDQEASAHTYIDTFGIPYPNGIDDTGEIAINYGVRGIPEKFFIDRDGLVQRKFVGPIREDKLREALDELLAAGGSVETESGTGTNPVGGY
jgi:cytochrome c biogenesis protein CcmG/thiol:disulfide interchange protein DsbE